MTNNKELLQKDLIIIIKLATDILLKDSINFVDEIDTTTLEKALQVKKLLTTIDNLTNVEIPF